MQNSANIMRIALIGSIILHVLFMVLSGHDLRVTTHGQVMDVDIVPASEVPVAVEEPKADTESAPSKSQQPEAKPETRISEPSVPQPPAEQSVAREQAARPSQPPQPASTPSQANE
ncbi:MAG: hypothetical protein WAM77_15940, partial [Xanthobacteraceae bacterium]